MRQKTITTICRLALICAALSPALLRAQPVPVQQFNENQQQRQLQNSLQTLPEATLTAPELYPGENKDVGPQYILRLKPRPTYLEVLADTQYAYTDNDRLGHQNEISTAYAVDTLQLAFAPEAMAWGPGTFSARGGFRSQWYNYGLDGSGGGEDNLNFEAQTLFAEAQYRLLKEWVFDTELDYTRLVSQRNYKQFYTEVTPIVTLTHLAPLAPNVLLAFGWEGDYHFTQVPSYVGAVANDVNNRFDNVLSASITWQVVGNFIAQPYYRFTLTDYPRTSLDMQRTDYLQDAGVALSYYFTQQLALRVFVGGEFRQSDDPNTTTYKKVDTGIGASFLCRF